MIIMITIINNNDNNSNNYYLISTEVEAVYGVTFPNMYQSLPFSKFSHFS